MNNNIEIGHLTKFDAFRSNGDQVTDLKTVKNPYKRLLRLRLPKPYELLKNVIRFGTTERSYPLFGNRRGENHFVCLVL